MRLAPKLLSAGLVALSSSPSDANQPQQLRGIPVVVGTNGDGGCRDGEECEWERGWLCFVLSFFGSSLYHVVTQSQVQYPPCVASCRGAVFGYL